MPKKKQREFEYDVFISYRHEEPDKTIAKKLMNELERYTAPFGASNNGLRKINKVFMDRDELPATDDLSESIKYALQNSRFLIVVCSPHVREKPHWIENEIESFTQYRGKKYIQTLLIEGEPEEAFPDSLLYETIKSLQSDGSEKVEIRNLEFLAADIRPEEMKRHASEGRQSYGMSIAKDKELLKKSLKLLKTERLRCLAPMFGCKYDDLYRRHMRRTVRTTVVAALATIVLLGGFLTYAVAMNNQLTLQIEETNQQRKEAQKQEAIASANAEKAKKNAEEALLQKEEAERQAKLARTNEAKAVASTNEANRQAGIAKDNELLAVANAQEAEKQRVEAESQKIEAEKQKEEAQRQQVEAEKQRKAATKQKTIAVSQRNKALLSQSLFLSDLSEQLLKNGDRLTAMSASLEALPKKLSKPDRPQTTEAELSLRNALQKTYNNYIPGQHIRDESYFISADISPDGKMLVTTSQGAEYASVWDVSSGNLIHTLAFDSTDDGVAKFSPDGGKIATSNVVTTILWDTKNWEKLITINAFNSTKDSKAPLVFSPNGRRIVVYNAIFSVTTGRKVSELVSGVAVCSARYSPDGSKLALALGNKTAKVWGCCYRKLII